jgi:hypothetical protein
MLKALVKIESKTSKKNHLKSPESKLANALILNKKKISNKDKFKMKLIVRK